MKKQVLSALAFCSALGIAQAQTDVTKEYLVNPSFETLKAADGTTDVAVKTKLESGLYGWEISKLLDNEFSNYQVESEASGSSTGIPANGIIKPSQGEFYYFNRQGWGNVDGSELKTSTSKNLPIGTYYAVIDYKAADYSNNNDASKSGTTIGIKAENATNELLGENTAVRRAYSTLTSNSDPYMVNAAWNELGTMFTVTEPTTVTISLVQNMKNSGRSDIAYDNLRLYKIENVSESTPMDVSGLIT